MASKTGRSGLAAVSGPEARTSSWPCSAGPLLPETGASTNVTSGRATASRSRKSRVAWTPIVPICAHTLPSANAATTPPSKMTDSTAAAVGSMVITTSASRTASGADAAAPAPAPARAATAPGDPSQTRVSRPATARFLAIADPMMPAPITATTVRAALPFTPAITVPFLLRPVPPTAGTRAVSSTMAAGPAPHIAANWISQVPASR